MINHNFCTTLYLWATDSASSFSQSGQRADPRVTCSWLTIRVGNCPDDKCINIHHTFCVHSISHPSTRILIHIYSQSFYLIMLRKREKRKLLFVKSGPILSGHNKFSFFLVNIRIWSIKCKYCQAQGQGQRQRP